MYIQYLYSTKTMKLLLSIIKKKGFEDIRSYKSKKDRQHTDQKKKDRQHTDQKNNDKNDKQWCAKHYTED